MALLEVCCGNLESVDAAVLGGARRIELCANLELDGLTPPIDWLRAVKVRYPELTVHVLIRSRAGDFCYAPEEVDTMVRQAEEALAARELIKGRVLEASLLTAREACEQLAEATGAEGIQSIGSRFVLYRPDPKEPKYILPKA